MILFTVMDHDVLTFNDFAGEAYLSLNQVRSARVAYLSLNHVGSVTFEHFLVRTFLDEFFSMQQTVRCLKSDPIAFAVRFHRVNYRKLLSSKHHMVNYTLKFLRFRTNQFILLHHSSHTLSQISIILGIISLEVKHKLAHDAGDFMSSLPPMSISADLTGVSRSRAWTAAHRTPTTSTASRRSS